MKMYAGVTDNAWYSFLAKQGSVDEVNFWHPSGKSPFAKLPEGAPVLFKLKSPHHHIAGGGFFIKFTSLPLRLAWEVFGQKNGAATFREFEALITAARARHETKDGDIGCSLISAPFFFPRESWIPVDAEFPRSGPVTGKYFDTSEPHGRGIWDAVQSRLNAQLYFETRAAERPVQFGEPVLVRPRRGQATFRALVTNAYSRRCAITGESTLPVLEAAHIKPVAADGLHNTFNGILLRSDFHKLFDVGLVTVSPEHRVLVSSRIKEQWFNGKAYNRLHGEKLASLPLILDDHPRADFLRWHNDNVFERDTRNG